MQSTSFHAGRSVGNLLSRQSRLSPSTKRPVPVTARFMRSGDEDVGVKDASELANPQIADLFSSSKSLDEALQRRMDTVSQHARDSIGWLRHAFQDPDDFSASAIGRMVSKEYGRHERPHTEHHKWRSPAASPVGSPTAQQATATTATSTTPGQAPAGPQPVAAKQQQGARWGWGWGGPVSSNSDIEVFHSPPSGPGFLLQQQQQQKRQD